MFLRPRDWCSQSARTPEKHVILAGTNSDVQRINDLCQQARFAAGLLVAGPLHHLDGSFYVGDRLLCTKKSRILDLENGDIGTILAIDHARRILHVQLDGEKPRQVFIPLNDYKHASRAYAMSTHKAQGATFDRASVLLGGSLQDLHLSYVQASRARHETRFYADRLEAGQGLKNLVDQMSLSRQKDLAHDVLAEQTAPAQKQSKSPNVDRTQHATQPKMLHPYWDGSPSKNAYVQPSPDALKKLADIVPLQSKRPTNKAMKDPSEKAKQLLERLRRIKDSQTTDRPVNEMANVTKEVHELLVRLRNLRNKSNDIGPPSR